VRVVVEKSVSFEVVLAVETDDIQSWDGFRREK
jgi:hypothetical protein